MKNSKMFQTAVAILCFTALIFTACKKDHIDLLEPGLESTIAANDVQTSILDQSNNLIAVQKPEIPDDFKTPMLDVLTKKSDVVILSDAQKETFVNVFWFKYKTKGKQDIINQRCPHFPKIDVSSQALDFTTKYNAATKEWMSQYQDELIAFE